VSPPSQLVGLFRARLAPLAAFLLAALIFLDDTFTPETITVAVLYTLVILISASFAEGRRMTAISLACAVLTVLSYMVEHTDGAAPALERCLVSLCSNAVTTILVLRSQAATRTLRQSEARYRGVFDSAGAMLWEIDLSEVRRMLNDLRAAGVKDLAEHLSLEPGFLGKARDGLRLIDANDMTLRILQAPGKAALQATPRVMQQALPLACVLNALWTGEAEVKTDTELERFDGSRIAVHSVVTLAPRGAQRDRALVSMFDVTERNRTQEALLEAQAALTHVSRVTTLGELAASIAHEVNQPLAAIVTNGQAALRFLDQGAEAADQDAREALEQMVADAERSGQVIQRLRRIARKGGRQVEAVNLAGLVEETLQLVRREIARNQIELRLDLDGAAPAALAERVELQQVLINLIVNAIHAMEGVAADRRVLSVSLRACDGQLETWIADSGAGLTASSVDQLFQPFFTTRPDGMGMGLSICRSIVEAHGGRIWAESEEGQGATMQFVLPIDKGTCDEQ